MGVAVADFDGRIDRGKPSLFLVTGFPAVGPQPAPRNLPGHAWRRFPGKGKCNTGPL